MVCVAVATDDGARVKVGHFGDARFYLHYVREGGGWRLVRRVENPFAGEHEHGGRHAHGREAEETGKRRRIFELNSGCDVFVAVAMGPGGREFMESRGKRVVFVRPGTSVEEALRLVEEALGAEA